MHKFKKILTSVLVVLVVNMSNPSLALAITAPTPPTAPEAPEAPEAPTPPTAPEAPEAPPWPGSEEEQTQENDNEVNNNESSGGSDENTGSNENQDNSVGSAEADSSQGNSESAGGSNESAGGSSNNSNGATGTDTVISTGDATNDASIVTTGNNNSSSIDPLSSGGAHVINSDNGSDSTNSGSATVVDNDTTVQDNQANVVNNLDQSTTTGKNSASSNTGGSNLIETGDANTTGTIITAVNTNVDGVAVSEFNVVDDHVGDIILDFGQNCIAGCTTNAEVKNAGNGDSSTNDADLSTISNDITFQNNDATVENSMTLDSDSGSNRADRNTNSDSAIITGDANVAANVLTFANNNIAGNIIYGVVNIFGDLIGDIILPEGALACCTGDTLVANVGNGTDSTNDANVNIVSADETFQFNNADIENNLVFDATTGDNNTSRNTNGTSSVETGDANVNAQVLNVANTNISGGDWWLVIINEAGQWFGKIIGTDGANFAGSDGFAFDVDENGAVTASNVGNGADTVNTATVDQETNNTVVQTNNAKLVNNVNLSANSGGNSTSRNTGGSNSITTGDANIIANIANFVNNNIVGDGNLVITVVNVFGSWFGDFISPGQSKSESSVQASDESNNDSNFGVGGYTGGEISDLVYNDSANSDVPANSNIEAPQIGYLARQDSAYGFVRGSEVASASISNEGENEIALVGSDSISSGNNQNDGININLAWLVILLPTYIVFAIAKKKNILAFVKK